MKQERFARVKELLLEVADFSMAERAAYLDEACSNDPELRREVESLLARDGNSTILKNGHGPTQAARQSPREIGPYRIEGILGAGGMGVVYCAWDGRLERQVALKVLPEVVTADPRRVERFEREAKLLAALNHPNIATVHTLEESAGVRFITMELVPGKTLAERLGAGPLALGDALSYCRQIAKALEAAHKREVIHRDLKPANVKITPDGRVKVLDFGIAKAMGDSERGERVDLTATGGTLGTPGYMSPEQIRGKPTDHRADIWAFGCVLYECLTGKQAFDGDTATEVVAATLEREPDWSVLPGETPVAMQELVRRCLTKDAAERLSEIAEARRTVENELAWGKAGPTRVIAPGGSVAPRNNLPAQLTSFVGRRREAAKVQELLASARLLTLTGVGGCGKTRLALHVAGETLEAHPDGVWLVELAPLADATLVPQTVARVFDLREQRGRTVMELLIDRLRDKRALLILDNCEHLLGACAELADTLLHACPELKILASSREGLGITGETTYHVPSLELPVADASLAVDQLEQVDAVQLFVERASAALPEFALTGENAAAVVEICRRLDGIPLAIELAAARIKVMSAAEIAGRLDDRFRLLGGGSRTALPRHQTLRSLIDWSHEQLTEAEARLLRRLSVFAGGWTVRAAEGVCDGEGIEEWEVLDLLSHLVDKSLVEMDAESRARTGQTRYRLFETVRQYAREHLLRAGEAGAVRARHRDFYLALAEDAAPRLRSAEQLEWFDRLDAEHDNMRVALETCASTDSAPELGARLVIALHTYWEVRGFWTEGRAYSTELLRRSDSDEAARIRALAAASKWAQLLGNVVESRRLLEESLHLTRRVGAHVRPASVLFRLGKVAYFEGDCDRARELTEEALTLYRDLGDKHGTLHCLVDLAELSPRYRELERSIQVLNETLAMARETGDRVSISEVLSKLGARHHQASDFAKARSALEEGLNLARELRMPGREGGLLDALACLAHTQGRLNDCRALSEDALAISRELGVRGLTARSLEHLALAVENQGDDSAAETLYAEALEIQRRLGNRYGLAWSLSQAAVRAARRHDADRARVCIEEALGIHEELGRRDPATSLYLGYALARLGDHARARRLLVLRQDSIPEEVADVSEALAVVAMGVGEPKRAARLLGAAEALRERIGAPRLPVYRGDFETDQAALRSELGDEAFAQALAEGRAMEMQQAIAYASGETEGEQAHEE